MVDKPKRCRSCRAPVAGEDAGAACPRCGRPVSDSHTSPPVVPADFWETPDMRSALRSRHMGKVIRAYRQHPHHGYGGLAQSEVAGWAGISQGQVSRIETGPPPLRLDHLIYWSLLLGIPQQYLWFELPDSDRPETWPRRRTSPRRTPHRRSPAASHSAAAWPARSLR